MTISVLEFKQEYASGKPVDMVLIAPTGEGHQKTQTWHRVEKLRPPHEPDSKQRDSDTYVAMHARWSVIGPAYDAYKNGEALPENGTPLAAWSGVTVDQASHLKSMGLKSVEDVRDMSDSAVSKLPFPDARKLPNLAGAFLEGEDAAAKDKKMAAMQEQMDAMAEMLEAQTKPAAKGKAA